MTAYNDFTQRFTPRARLGLALGAVLIVGATVALGAWTLRADYQVLFADLAPQDAATMAAELDKMKTPYRLSGQGNTLLVPAELVYKTRLKLVGKELPLRGAVGLELFNSSEVGMTEFTQKVNYQRALQGEITRTILSLEEVQSVRVHLVLSEQALFKKSTKQAKASITMAMKPGRALDASQVQGIQRLVGAAVPDIRPDDVTIVDQHGVALTRRSAADGGEAAGAPGSDSLDEKRALETYLNKKVVEVLDRTFGAGQGIASVDVTLSHNHTKVTTENVLGGKAGESGVSTGVMVRERQSSRDGGAASDSDAARGGAAGVSNHEADYQVGRRVEQVVSGAGGVSRINVAVVVRGVLDQSQLDRLKDVVALAAGINKERGDGVSVYSVDQVASVSNNVLVPQGALDAAAAADARTLAQAAAAPSAAAPSAPSAAAPTWNDSAKVIAALAGVALLALLALAWRLAAAPARKPLSGAERQQLLDQVNGWLDGSSPVPQERI